MTAAARRKPRPKASEISSRDRLLEAASQILSQRHTVEVSFSEIAKASRLNSALIKYYFGSKDGLLLALVRRDAARAIEQLEHLVRMPLAPAEKIRLHVAGIVNTYVKYPYLNRLIHALLGSEDERIPREIAEFFVKPLASAEAKILEEGLRLGKFERVDPMHFYFAVVGACDHLFFARASRKYAFGVREVTATMRERYIAFITEATLGLLQRPQARPLMSAPAGKSSHE